MTTVWAYPWGLTAGGLDHELAALAEMGVDAVTVAAHYHSVQTLLPRGEVDDGVFESYSGGYHFAPDSGRFADTAIDPPVNVSAADGEGDAFGAVVDAAREHGLDVNAWTVCLHNSRLGATNPGYRIQSTFGDTHDHALCPSWPAVREYYASVIDALRDYDIARIDLESVGFANAFHGHGHKFGHLKNHVVTSPEGEFLLSQCFCDGCRAAAADHVVDIDAAASLVQDLAQQILEGPTTEPPSFSTLADHHAEFRALLEFRATVIERFLSDLADASGTVPLNYYVADGFGRGAEDGRPAGVRLDRLNDILDSVTALCYTHNSDVAQRRLHEIRDRFGDPVHGAVTLDPDVISTVDAFNDVVATVRDTSTGDLQVYNYSLLGPEQRDWLSAVS